VVRRYLRVFETFAVEELAFLLDRDVIVHEGGTTVRGLDWVSAAVRTPGLAACRIEIDDLFAARDRVMVACTVTYTREGSGQQLTLSGLKSYRLRNGLIVELWGAIDVFGFLRRAGLVPQQAWSVSVLRVRPARPGRRLYALKRLWIGERAAHARPVGGQRPDLEMRPPQRIGRRDCVLAGEAETEARVEVGRAEQRDQRLPQRVGRAEHCVHEGAADASALPVGSDGERAERERSRRPDASPSAHHMPTDVSAGVDSDQRKRGKPGVAGAQCVHQRRLGGRPALPRLREGGRRDRVDGIGVFGRFPAYQHRRRVSRLATARQLNSGR
jgi:SnoaL-like domain